VIHECISFCQLLSYFKSLTFLLPCLFCHYLGIFMK
jgi:hypothetical protein